MMNVLTHFVTAYFNQRHDLVTCLKKSKQKYSVIQIVRFCTDTFCTPARFGN